ncbi:MAG: adenylate/guanylate cyclase domain-containing protein [Actinobacteria bacterium]|nr:adenylate/guanylate cyclase domain-containing protein [Actinomycetota bacterium]
MDEARGNGQAGVPADPNHYPRPVQARTTVRGVLILQLLANAAGAAVILVYLRGLFPMFGGVTPTTPDLELNLVVLGVYLVVVVFVALPINKHILNKAVRWVKEGRVPIAKERRETIGQPLFQTGTAFLGWVSAAVVFGRLYGDARRIAVGVLLAGLVTCVLLYQLLERHFRPVFALALEDVELPKVRREVLIRIMSAWWLGSAIPLLAVGLAPIIYQDEQFRFTIGLSIAMLLLIAGGGLVMRAAAGGVSAPINEVRAAMAEVEDGNLDVKVPVTNVGEIGQLQVGFNRMVAGLRERRRLHDLLGRQVGTDVARQALETAPELVGEEREITAVFVDLANFTAFTERHTPAEVVAELNQFFAVVIEVVMSEGGWVNKFEGDAALCIFGAPARQPDHAARALRAAARLPAAVAALANHVRAGIGVASGHVVAGNVGTPERYEYTVIGDAVNVASRLTELAKGRDPSVLVSEATVRAAGADDASTWEAADTVTVRGRSKPITVYRPSPAGREPVPTLQ